MVTIRYHNFWGLAPEANKYPALDVIPNILYLDQFGHCTKVAAFRRGAS